MHAGLVPKGKGVTIKQESVVDDSKEIDQSLLEKLVLSDPETWDDDNTKGAKVLLLEYSSIFAKEYIDLSKTSFVKHSIKHSNLIPFKERYR